MIISGKNVIINFIVNNAKYLYINNLVLKNVRIVINQINIYIIKNVIILNAIEK